MIFITTLYSELFISADNTPHKISPQNYHITEIFGGVINYSEAIFWSVLSAFTYLNLHIFIYLYKGLFLNFFKCICITFHVKLLQFINKL